MTGRVLVARLDSIGDVLLAGPAVRAVAAHADHVAMLAGPRGRAGAELLPGVDEVLEYCAPWIDPEPPELTRESVEALVKQVRDLRLDAALILTSFHQSPLPLALVLRMAGVRWIGGISEDYPGSLLDLRHRVDGDPPEVLRALSLARAAGYELPEGDNGAPAIRGPLPDTGALTGPPGYVVVHPAASVPARQPTRERATAIVRALAESGHRVVVTGAPDESGLTARIAAEALATTPGAGPAAAHHAGAAGSVTDLGGATDLAELASVLAHARVVVAPNTGPAHLAAAVGAPVVSLFAPVVPAARWAPYGVPRVVLGDQDAPCKNTRARHCPVEGHPCLAVDPVDVVHAVDDLARGGRGGQDGRVGAKSTGGVS